MKYFRHIIPSLLILALAGGLAIAQKSVQLSQDPTGAISVDTNNNVYFPAHILSPTAGKLLPVLTGCSTGGSPLITGTDLSGVITAGTTASTSCVVTFGTAFVTAPNCVVSWQTGPLAAMSWTTSTTALTITQTSNASSKIAYICTSAS